MKNLLKNYNELAFRWALVNDIYNSISEEVYKEVGCKLPIIYMFYIDGTIDNEDVKKYIILTGEIW